MDIFPQFTYDNKGNPLGVFLSMQDWEKVARKMEDEPVEPWEKELILKGLEEYRKDPESTVDWDTIKEEMDKEDGRV
jgi:hypothetical protein